MFGKRFKIIRTIFPYEDGWGVIIEQFGKNMIVLATGLSKEEAEDYRDSVKKDHKEGRL